MDCQRIKLNFCLFLLIFTAQGMLAFVPNFGTIEAGKSSIEYRENTQYGFGYFKAINTLKIEAATPKIIPVVFNAIPYKNSLEVKWVNVTTPCQGCFVRDQKHGLKILVFPFHSFW